MVDAMKRSPIVLPDNATEYIDGRFQRASADPLGYAGFPKHRAGLDSMVYDLCRWLENVGLTGLGGKKIAEHFWPQNSDPRKTRLLVAYARVHCHRHEIVGIPGQGYVWGDLDPDIYKKAIIDNEQRARDYFFIAALHRRQGVAMSAAQLVLDFMEHNVPAESQHNDDLAALFAAEGTSIADFLDAFMQRLAETADGRSALQRAGEKHSDLLIPANVRSQIREIVAEASAHLRTSLDNLAKIHRTFAA